jgi:Reverse transcriptase (RNA-dependent DNA polymerase)
MSQDKDPELLLLITTNLKDGLIRHSSSQISSPILFVKIKDGSKRMCIDYRQINKYLKKDIYVLPRIDTLLERFNHKNYFTTINLRDAYIQICMHPGSEDYTFFSSKYDTYAYRVMPFGLQVSPGVYQRYINSITKVLTEKGVIAFMDDIIVATTTLAFNVETTHQLLYLLLKNNLQSKITKCTFFSLSVDLLGFRITNKGIAPQEKSINTIKKWERPSKTQNLQSFICFLNYLRQYIKSFSEKVNELQKLLTSSKKEITWSPSAK